MKRKNEKKKETIHLILFLILILFLGGGMLFYGLSYKNEENRKAREIKKEEKQIEKIKSHYAKHVEVLKDSDFYHLKDDEYFKQGTFKKGYYLSLEEIDIDSKTKYFKLEDYDYYLSYENLKPSNEIKEKATTKFIVFNENVKTKNKVSLYQNNKELIVFEESMELPILKKEKDYYEVIYDEDIFTIKKDEIETSYENNNTDREAAQTVPVLNYHFLFDPNNKNDSRQLISLDINIFKEHLQYLNDHDYLALTMEEFELWYSKKIRIPKKSVLITFDDGTLKTDVYLGPTLEEYKINGTLFLVSSWFNPNSFRNEYLEVQSHTHDLHGISGPSPALSKTKKELLQDFDASLAALGQETIAFAYPFYQYNDNLVEAVSERFKLAFVGGNRRASQNSKRYLIPRIIIYNYHNLESFKKIIS